MRLRNLARALLASARARQPRGLAHEVRRRFHSNWLHYGLRRDLTEPFEAPSAKIPLTIRPLRPSDLPVLLGMDTEQMSERGPYVRMHRLNFSQESIGQCYVAATQSDEPCYMQWLMPGSDNPRIEKYFHGIFPTLAADEALLEYAFTREGLSGQGDHVRCHGPNRRKGSRHRRTTGHHVRGPRKCGGPEGMSALRIPTLSHQE